MLLGQTRVLYSMARDGLLPESSRRRASPSSALLTRTRYWSGCSRPIVGSVTPIDDIGEMVNIGTSAGVRNRVTRVFGCFACERIPISPARFALRGCRCVPILGFWLSGLDDDELARDNVGAFDHMVDDRTGGVLLRIAASKPGSSQSGTARLPVSSQDASDGRLGVAAEGLAAGAAALRRRDVLATAGRRPALQF